MKTLAKYFTEELPRINNVLEEILAKIHPAVREVSRYVVLSGGKRLRPLLLFLFASSLGCQKKSVYNLAAAFELLHSASLLHDDILDQAESRRNQKAAHLVYGLHNTILAGDALFARASSLVAAEDNPRMVTCFSEAMEFTVAAEVQELELVHQPEVSMTDYLEVITGKTAYLIQACCKFGVLAAGGSEQQLAAAAAYGLNIGIAFQLVDDAIDYSASEDVSGKPQGGDLREGKLTLPLIFYLQDMAENDRVHLLADLRTGNIPEDKLQALLQDINASNCPQRTRETASNYLEAAKRELDCFPQGEARNAMLEIITYILQREK